MRTMNELEGDILKTTSLIDKEHPELAKYLEEMPVTIPDNGDPVITTAVLNEYNESLKLLLVKYARPVKK
ncbi:MAG: hypothetical protein JNM19_03300 [Chitinophagaceae bacterium]|nr:hypothetical protein [Chitinophagaceae bacterium]